jgi:hypothetical protein
VPLNLFAFQAAGAATFEPLKTTPEVGHIVRYAASGPYLFVFFNDGTHQSYSQAGRRIEIDLPGRTVPEAVTGMTGERRIGLYAIVRRRIGQRIPRAAPESTRAAPPTTREGRPTTEARPPDPRAPASEAQPAAEPAAIQGVPAADDGFDLVAYESARWRYVAPVEHIPPELKAIRWWLCASAEAVFVLWAPEAADAPTALTYLRWSDRTWTPPRTIHLGAPMIHGTAMYLSPWALFAAGLRGSAGGAGPAGQEVAWQTWRLVDEEWQAGEPLDFGEQPGQRPDPGVARTALATLGQNILVATVRPDESIHVGLWPPEGGQARKPFQQTKAFDRPREPLVDAQTREWLGLIVVVGVIILVFWRRQESL